MVIVKLGPLEHKGQLHIAIAFGYNNSIKQHLLRYGDVKWSKTHKTFYVLDIVSNRKGIYNHLRQIGLYVDYSALKTPVQNVKTKQPKIKKTANKALYKTFTLEQKQLIKNYIGFLEGKRLSKSTISAYGHFVLRFIDYAKASETEHWTTKTIDLFLENVLAKENYSISSHRQCVSALKYLTQFCDIPNFDGTLLKRPKKSKYLPQVLSKEEIIDLIRSTKNLKHRAVIALLYSSGLRISELLHLKLTYLDLDRNQIHIKQAKGRKDRTVMLSEALQPLLLNYLQTYRPSIFVFEGQKGGIYSASSIRSFLKRSCKLAGITKPITPHTLRHSYATHLLDNGIGIRHIQQLLGHSKPETTMIYTHVSNGDLKAIKSPLDTTISGLLKKDNNDKKPLLSRNL